MCLLAALENTLLCLTPTTPRTRRVLKYTSQISDWLFTKQPHSRPCLYTSNLATRLSAGVHYHTEKIYACFVDFRKAFDKVWHVGLLHKLLAE